VLIQGPIRLLTTVSSNGALIIFAAITLIIAFVGYELIHRLGAALTFVSTVLFLAASYLLVSKGVDSTALVRLSGTQFSLAAFVLTTTQAAAWALSYGPYVADYSRYLPPTIPPSKTFWYTAAGCCLSSVLVMAFGAYLAATQPVLAKDPANAIAGLFGAGRPIVLILIVTAVVQGNVMNLYSAYMSVVTIFSGLRGITSISRIQKLIVMAFLMTLATAVSMVAQENFDAYFSDMLNIMIYLLVPWSAINLADYYVVQKGVYDIPDMFQVAGRYGAYRWKTIAVYAIGVAVQEPFMSFSFYRGPFAQAIGADIAWLPGLLVAGLLHIAVERNTPRNLTSP